MGKRQWSHGCQRGAASKSSASPASPRHMDVTPLHLSHFPPFHFSLSNWIVNGEEEPLLFSFLSFLSLSLSFLSIFFLLLSFSFIFICGNAVAISLSFDRIRFFFGGGFAFSFFCWKYDGLNYRSADGGFQAIWQRRNATPGCGSADNRLANSNGDSFWIFAVRIESFLGWLSCCGAAVSIWQRRIDEFP